MSTDRPGPLTGIRVLDTTRVLSGPACSRMLADMGAEVVKVEAPEPDITRQTPPRVNDVGCMFTHFNVGKRNICVDLKAEGAADFVARLAEQADVFLENFRPGVLERLGLGATGLLARNPRLVYCSITGWGQTGPWAERPAYAPIVQAEAGTMHLGGKLRGSVQAEFQQHGDVYAGVMACNAITAALFERERTGRGQHLDVSMGETLQYVNEHAASEFAGEDGPYGFATWKFRTYRLGNGRDVHILGTPDQTFPAYARVFGMEEVLSDPRFATPEALAENVEAAVDWLAEQIAKLPDQQALEEKLRGLPMIVSGLRSCAELMDSDWAAHRELAVESEVGIPVPRAPWRSSTSAIGTDGSLAHRGRDNRAVATEWLSLGDDELASLEAAGVLEEHVDAPPDLASAPRSGYKER